LIPPHPPFYRHLDPVSVFF